MMKTVPNGWKIEKLGNIAEYVNGKAFKPSEWADVGLPIIRIQNLNGNNEYNFYNNDIEDRYRVNDGDILISWSASLDVYKWHGGKAVLNQHIFNTKIDNNKTTDDYFYYSIKKALNTILANLHGSTMKHITKGKFENIEIPLPPLPQQEKIVSVLDTASQLVEKQKALIEKYDLFLKSKFIEMFGDPVLNPMGWEVAPLKKFGKVITGNTPSRKVDEYYNDDYIEWIKTDNISSDQLYVSEASEYLSEEGMEKSRVLQKGALLTTCIAGSLKSIGNACLTDRTVCFNQQINAIQPNEDCHPLFLYAMFGVAKNYIQTFATSSMKKIITKGEFEKIEFIKPPFELQGKYAAILEKVYVMKAQEQKKLEKLQTLYDALMQRAFKGEIQ